MTDFLRSEEALQIRKDLGKLMGEKWGREEGKLYYHITNYLGENNHKIMWDGRVYEELTNNFLSSVLEKLIEDDHVCDVLVKIKKGEVHVGANVSGKVHEVAYSCPTELEARARMLSDAVKYIQEENDGN